jgi:hypothetical protein
MKHKVSETTLSPQFTEASRRRQLLRHLVETFRRQVHSLLACRALLKGSLDELKTRSGKPSCHCASPQGPLHSAMVLSWSQQGRTRLRSIPRGEQARLRRLTAAYRQFRQTRARLVQLHRQILAAVDRLEKALRLPPPGPASKKRRRA